MAIPRNLANLANQLNTDGEAPKIEVGDSSVVVTDSGTGKIEFTVDNVEVADFATDEVVFNETGADQDFRVEGDTDTHLLFARADSDFVGIGYSAPKAKLHVHLPTTNQGEALRLSSSADAGVVGTVSIGMSLNASDVEPAVRIEALEFDASDYRASLLFYTRETNNLSVAPLERMRITSTGEVYIAGTTDRGAYNLQCNGTGVWGAGAYVNGSDKRLKENIANIESGLDVVTAMRPVTFTYKKDYSKNQKTQTGFIAQELQQVMAEKNYVEGVVQEGPKYLNVAYQNLIPILTKAIQELKAELDTVKTELVTLKGR